MANFFNYFPKTPYLIEDGVELSLVTNIITRIKFIDKVKEIISSYFTYDIAEGETPESLAHKFYGTAQRHWIILLLNDVIDPQHMYGWYLSSLMLNKFVDAKYAAFGGYAYAKSNVKKYLVKQEKTVNFTRNPITTTEIMETDYTTWSSLPTSTSQTLTISATISPLTATIKKTKYTQTHYEFEFEENEKRRSIKILKKEYVNQVESEMKDMANMKIKSSI